jgi:hypothetical protein
MSLSYVSESQQEPSFQGRLSIRVDLTDTQAGGNVARIGTVVPSGKTDCHAVLANGDLDITKHRAR